VTEWLRESKNGGRTTKPRQPGAVHGSRLLGTWAPTVLRFQRTRHLKANGKPPILDQRGPNAKPALRQRDCDWRPFDMAFVPVSAIGHAPVQRWGHRIYHRKREEVSHSILPVYSEGRDTHEA
jgi:hypothetical protein